MDRQAAHQTVRKIQTVQVNPCLLYTSIAKYYKPEEMVGKKVAVITNLKPCKLCGVESQGMILAAADDADNLSVLTVDKDMIAGSEIR